MSFPNNDSISEEEKAIYLTLKPPILTVIIGAKCSNGIVMIADRKVTDFSGQTIHYTNKIFGDLRDILIGYGGGEEAFDIFRKYIVGEVTLLRSDENKYTFDNLIPNMKRYVLKFNKFVEKLNRHFEILVGLHRKELSDLYYIKKNGEIVNSDYIALGSGEETANKFLKNVKPRETTMKDFAKRACLAIMYMSTQPDSRVGVEPTGFPTIIYLDYNKETDEPAPQKDIEEFRIFIEKKRNL